MAEMRCGCGKVVRYADDMRGVLSCPQCGETLARFGDVPIRPVDEPIADEPESAAPVTPSAEEMSELPPRLSDPLLVYRYIVGAITGLISLALIVHCLSCVAPPLGAWMFGADFERLSLGEKCFVVGMSSIPLVLGWWFSFAIWQILPNRRTNAFYLRTFVTDRTTSTIRQDAQNALGRNFRLSGIRDPRRRWPVVIRWILAIVLVFRYCTPKYMNLEAGDNWKARLWRSLGDARCALIDVSKLTSYVMEEIEMCVRCLGVKRVLFVGDQTRDEDGWKEYVRAMLPVHCSKSDVNVAVWTATSTGRKDFRAAVARFADGLPVGVAGLNMDTLKLTRTSVLPEVEPSEYHGALGWMEVIAGWVLSTAAFFLVGFLPGLGDFGKTIYLAFLAAFGVLFFWSFACYVIDCGPGYRRRFALAAIGGPFLCVLVLIGLLVPAVQKVREAAERASVSNNLKEIALAHHSFHSSYRRLPAAVAFNTSDGKPGLSWRVALLPYLEQNGLYRQFHLDEPWDSRHNLKLLPLMPRVYKLPTLQDEAAKGLTRYQVFVGPATPFDTRHRFSPRQDPLNPLQAPSLGLSFGMFLTSNTILVALADEPVPWTKPDDIPYRPNEPLPWRREDSLRNLIVLADGTPYYLMGEEREEAVLRSKICPFELQVLRPGFELRR